MDWSSSYISRKYAYPGQRCPLGTKREKCIDEQTRVVKGDFMNREEKSLAVRPRRVSRYNILREFIGCENWDASILSILLA